jgi:uncharacterized OB-fold protein
MEGPAKHWRLNAQRYAMEGVTCLKCGNNIFPPRDICPYCEASKELVGDKEETTNKTERVLGPTFLREAAK